MVEVDWSKVSDRDFGADADLRYLGMSANSSHRLNLSRARSAGLKLISLAIDTLRMEDILNEANRARNEMADEGRDARVVIETWVVAEAELADAVSRGGRHGVSVSAAGQSLSLRFGGNSRSSHTVVLPENATFAYALGKVSDWGRRRETVEDVDLDYKGLN